MKKKKQRLTILAILLVLDILVVSLSLLAAYGLRFNAVFFTDIFPVTKGTPSLFSYFQLLMPAVFIWILIFRFFGLYEVRPGLHKSLEVYQIFKAVTAGIVVLLAFTFFYREESYSRLVILLIWIFNIVFMTFFRLIAREVQKKLFRRGYGVFIALVVGAGKIGEMIRVKMESNPASGHRIIGFLDDAYSEGTVVEEKEILGKTDKLAEILRQFDIDEVIIALPFRERQKILELAFTCEENYVKALVVPDLFELIAEEIDINTLEGIPLMGLKEIPLSGWNLAIKRIEDLIFAVTGIVLSSPVLLIASVLVKISSKGHVIYKQERTGRDGRAFNIYKFRTMKLDAEKESGPVWAKQDDPRRTRVGAILRRLSVDELPQFFNILKGDMSFVGPRPERPVFVKKFNENIEKYFARHKVKSGLTGWAQVNGLRGDTSIEERVKYDLYYVEHWSLTFDIKILLMTFYQIVAGKNAY